MTFFKSITARLTSSGIAAQINIYAQTTTSSKDRAFSRIFYN
jgi:hypothetical protein